MTKITKNYSLSFLLFFVFFLAITINFAIVLINNILFTLLGSAFFVIIMLLFLRSVATPLNKIIAACEQVKKGNLSVKIENNHQTEIGELIDTFNGMVAELKKSRTALEETNDILEIKVKARTRQLSELVESQEITIEGRTKELQEKTKDLEEEQGKTMAVITNFADGLLFFNKNNELILINPQAENLLSIKSQSIIGKRILELIDFPTLRPIAVLVNDEKSAKLYKEIKLNEKTTLETNIIPVIRNNELIGTMIILRDISREKLIEQMKTEFVSLTAHQLRTPLSAIKWTLRMLLDGDLGKINVEQKSFLQKTYNCNERMIRLINDLLNVTRIEEGKFIYKASCVQLENIIAEVIDTFKDKIQMKEIDFHFKKPLKKLPPVMVDPEKIQIAISNLIDNAIDYTAKSGEISIFLVAGKEKLTFTIQDSGIGIPKDQQPRVFSKFFRADNVIKIDTDGTGLGAFIAKNIIEAHNGKIWFDSKEGKGTAFFFSLPIQAQQSSCVHPKK